MWKIRRGESILPKNHNKRKTRVLPFQHLVLCRLAIDPIRALRVVREDLSQFVALHGDDVANIPVAVIDDVVAERERRAKEVPMEQVERDATEDDSQTIDTAEERQRLTVPSVSALSRFLRGVTGTSEGREIPVITFKRCHVRGPTAYTDENKRRRIEAIEELLNKLRACYWWVCIDETSWRVGNTTAYGWAKR